VKGKIKKSFKSCVKHVNHNKDFKILWGAEVFLKSVLHVYYTGGLY